MANCWEMYEGNFCNLCGQPSAVHRIDFHFLWHDIQHGLFHFDKGILYSLKQLYIRPGHSIREFINGKRVDHFQPMILLAVFYGLLYHSFGIDNTKIFNGNDQTLVDYVSYNNWLSTHFSWIAQCSIPLYAIGTQLCFRKQGYNFAELLILNAFKAAQRLFFHIAAIPLLIVFSEPAELKKVLMVLYVADMALSVFTDRQFFIRMPASKAIGLSLAAN